MKTQALRSVRADIIGTVRPAYRPYRHHVRAVILGMVRLVRRQRQRRYQHVLADIGMVLNVSLQRLKIGHAHIEVSGMSVEDLPTGVVVQEQPAVSSAMIVVQM